MTGSDFAQAIPRYRLHLWRIVVRMVAVIALLEWWNGVTRGG